MYRKVQPEKFLQKCSNLLPVAEFFPNQQSQGWCDKKLAELRIPLSFPYLTYDRKNLKWILIRFFDLYLTGFIREEDFLTSVVFDMIALSETDQGKIWTIPCPEAVPFYKQNLSQPNSLSIVTVSRTFEIKFFNRYWGEKQRLFWNYIHSVIQNINPTEAATEEETELIKLGSFLALTLMRFAIRKKEQVSHCFHKDKYKENLAHMKLWSVEKPYSPPCERTLEICENGFKKRHRSTSNIFTIIVHEFVLTNNPNYHNSSAAIFLKNAVLSDTSRNGLGMIQLLQDVCTLTSMSWKEIMEKTLWDVTETSWERISTFFQTQYSVDNPQHSSNWARIIDDRYFKDLTQKENILLATVFAAVVAEVHGPGIWNAEWAKQSKNFPNAKIEGCKLYLYSQNRKKD